MCDVGPTPWGAEGTATRARLAAALLGRTISATGRVVQTVDWPSWIARDIGVVALRIREVALAWRVRRWIMLGALGLRMSVADERIC